MKLFAFSKIVCFESCCRRGRRWHLKALSATSVLALNLCAVADVNSYDAALDTGSKSRFTCLPSRVKTRDVLTLNFGSARASELIIITPANDYFFIAQRRLPGASRSGGMPSEILTGIAQMRLSLNLFKARKYHADAANVELVFSAPGTYKFLYGDVLESELVGNTQECKVRVIE